MDIALITELVASLGFPIVVVIALGWFIYQVYKKSEAREDKLMNEISETRNVNATAIATIAKFAENLDVIQRDVNEIKEDILVISKKIG